MGKIYINGVAYAGVGTNNYTELENKPKINGVLLTGNVSLNELGIAAPVVDQDLSLLSNNAIANRKVTQELKRKFSVSVDNETLVFNND